MILIAPSLDPSKRGGVQRVCRQVFRGLRKGPAFRGPHGIWIANDDDFEGDSDGEIQATCFGGRYFAMAFHAMRVSQQGTPPILCLHAGLSPIARVLGRRWHLPYAVFLHGIEVWGSLPFRTRWGLAGSSLFLANSNDTRKRFQSRHASLAAIPIQTVPLGLSDDLQVPPAETSPPPFARYILSVSRLDANDSYKGHETLLRAFRIARSEFLSLGLVIVGSGSDLARLRRISAELGLESSVLFMGAVSDDHLANLYRSCSAFALLSEGEGFGLVHLEAMWHAKPCLATHADAAREVIVDGETGILAPPRDAEAAAAVLLGWLRNPERAREMGEKGRERVLNNFLETHFHRRLSEALEASKRK